MTKKATLYIGVLTFSILIVLSILFYKERTVFLDISYHLFSILKDDSFAIQNNRFGAFFTQLFPLIGSKLGFSLQTIAVLYSMSFVILPLITFLLIHLYFKNTKVSVAYLLFTIAMTTHTFYWIQSELPQAIAFLFILIALLDRAVQEKTPSNKFVFLSSVLLFLVCFTHPLMLIVFTFLVLYYFLSHPDKKAVIASFGLTYFAFYVIKSLFFKTAYDSQAMGGMNNFLALFPNYFNLESNKNLIKYFIQDYYFVAILFAVTVFSFIRRLRYLKALLISAFFLGYCLLVNVSYPQGADQFYIENLYLVLAVIVAVPFVYEVLPTIRNPKIQYAIIGLICAAGVVRIATTQSVYSDRLSWYRDILTTTESSTQQKIIIPETMVPMDTLMMTWGSSYEFWLLSTIEKGTSRSVIIEESPGEFDYALPAERAFITKWGAFEYATLDSKYFIFRDTSGYVKVQE